ncbi:dynein regulatory complex subunit 6-like isoform X2 [Asterias rubens]|uniref:dynein regulatory complex subunit 6-like isoform X2 n=1 Tax=Asterias rubens TaxID=7604 RepID=UPI0014556F5B|nr:dynein regulatory complex subunit 6-like isoform X2 [Asterias rubens]
MASLKGVDPEIRKYLRLHKVPDVYEAILTGLAVLCPDDPMEYIITKLKELMKMRLETVHGLEALKWDTLIPRHAKPRKRLSANYLDALFMFDEENLQPWEWRPTPIMYQKAYQCYNNKLVTMTFSAWLLYHERKKRRRLMMARKMVQAAEYYDMRKQRVHLQYWMQWYRFRKDRQESAYNIIKNVYDMSLSRLVFEAWHNVMLEARRTREYFERLERGEMDGEDEMMFPRGEARDDISLLPRKLAIKIFSYLDLADVSRCAQVCRQWKMITGTSSLWSRVNLSSIKNRATDRFVCKLLQTCRPYLLHLNLRGCDSLTKPSYVAIGQCRNLQDLNLSECGGVNDDMMKDIAEGCQTLLYLNISHTNITDATLRLLGRWSRNLQYMSLAYCRRFSDKGLQYLANGRGCRKLVYLDLSGCPQITVTGYKNIANGCSNIQSLCVNDCATLKDESIVAIASKCHNIRNISFLLTPNITDVAFKAIAQHRKLQTIRVEGNTKLSDATFKYIGRYCADLRHVFVIDCPRVTDASLKSLAQCRNINVLNVADCIRISDNGVRSLVEGPSGPKIREMNLTNCVRVSDVSIIKIMQKCYSLVYGTFCFSEHITDGGAEMLGNLPALSSLDISGCSITDTGLGALGNNPRLRDVTLSECYQITDLGVQKFAQQCKDLERLDLSHCTQLTDGAIKNLAFCCRRLTVLNIAGCKNLTDLSIQYLSGVCHYLISLDLSGCVHVSDKSIRFLRKGCRRLRLLFMLYCKNISKASYMKLAAKVETVRWNDDPVPSSFGPGFDYLAAMQKAEADKKKKDKEKEKEKAKGKGEGDMNEKNNADEDNVKPAGGEEVPSDKEKIAEGEPQEYKDSIKVSFSAEGKENESTLGVKDGDVPSEGGVVGESGSGPTPQGELTDGTDTRKIVDDHAEVIPSE